MHAKIELYGTRKEGCLHSEPADQGKSDRERDQYGSDPPEREVGDERGGKSGLGPYVASKTHHGDQDDLP